LQESRINPIIQLSKHYYRRSQHEAGQTMCAAMNVFFHYRKLINFTMSLKWNMLIKRIGLFTCIGLFTGLNTRGGQKAECGLRRGGLCMFFPDAESKNFLCRWRRSAGGDIFFQTTCLYV